MRVETAGLLSPASLYKGMLNFGIHSQVASELYSHEKAHADADMERRGEFGFYITGGWIVVYYLIKGERTPEQLMEIASAPGFSRMSKQDWEVYNQAWRDLLNQVNERSDEDKIQQKEWEYLEKDDLKEIIIEKLAEKLDDKVEKKEFPDLKELLKTEFADLISEYGMLVYEAYKLAVEEIKNNYYSHNG